MLMAWVWKRRFERRADLLPRVWTSRHDASGLPLKPVRMETAAFLWWFARPVQRGVRFSSGCVRSRRAACYPKAEFAGPEAAQIRCRAPTRSSRKAGGSGRAAHARRAAVTAALDLQEHATAVSGTGPARVCRKQPTGGGPCCRGWATASRGNRKTVKARSLLIAMRSLNTSTPV